MRKRRPYRCSRGPVEGLPPVQVWGNGREKVECRSNRVGGARLRANVGLRKIAIDLGAKKAISERSHFKFISFP